MYCRLRESQPLENKSLRLQAYCIYRWQLVGCTGVMPNQCALGNYIISERRQAFFVIFIVYTGSRMSRVSQVLYSSQGWRQGM